MSRLVNFRITNPLLTEHRVANPTNLLKIRTKNIQKNTQINKFRELATYCDVLLIQETDFNSKQPANSQNRRGARRGARRAMQQQPPNYSQDPTPDWITSLQKQLNQANQELIYTDTLARSGIILNFQHQHFEKISSNNLQLDSEIARYATDVIIQLKETKEYILVISVYGPSGNHRSQEQLFHSLYTLINTLITNFEIDNNNHKLHLCIGGDFNMIQNPELDSTARESSSREHASRQAFNSLCNEFQLHDSLRGLEPTIKVPTNTNTNNCRRLDRIYLPRSFQARIWRYSHRFNHIVTSTHATVDVDLSILPDATLKVARPRFIIKDHWVDNLEFLNILSHTRFSDYSEFIQRVPKIIASLRQRPTANAHHSVSEKSTIFRDLNDRFKGAIHAAKIVKSLQTADKSRTATSTDQILAIQREHFAKLYLDSQPQEAKRSIRTYVQMFPQKIAASDQAKLDEPITLEEITAALQRTTNDSTPGEDGATFLFLKATWDTAGPLLVKDANNIMRNGLLPSSMALVLIRMIPKRKKADPTVDDYRPISLINTSLRVISQVLNMRLRTVIKNLIGYDQCGFMPERQMDFQIQRFRAIIDKVAEDPEKLKIANVIILDLTKAFDRVSHDYLSAVLDQIGLGPKFKRILLLVTTQQFAAIFTNNTKSETFPLTQGTRQGNPVLPILFNLCLEPLLYRLHSRLQGIPIQLDHLPALTAKYSAFADDLTVFTSCRRDHEILKEELSLFEQASNSLVSISKSRTAFWDQPPHEDIQRILGFEGLALRTSDHKYLGVPLNGFNWETYTKSLSTQLVLHSIKELPIHLRCTGFNTYIFSKVYFRDLHDPMQISDIKRLTKMVKGHLPPIGEQHLYNLKSKGGFGLLDMEQQLKGRRAKVIYETLTNLTDWNLIVFRDKLQSFMDYIFPPRTVNQTQREIVPWYRFLTDLYVREGSRARIEYLHYEKFTNAEKEWLKAWFQITKAKNFHWIRDRFTGRTTWYRRDVYKRFTTEEKAYMVRNPPIKNDWQHWIDLVDPSTFRSRSAKLAQAKPVSSSATLKENFQLTDDDYQQFWKAIAKVQRRYPKGVEEIHRVHLGHRDRHGSSEALPECLMCFNEIPRPQFFHHIYQDCSISRTLWDILRPTEITLNLKNLICNSSLSQAAYLSWNQYLLAVHLFRCRRRNPMDRDIFTCSMLSSWVSILQSRRLI